VAEGLGDVRVRPRDLARFDDGDAVAAAIAENPWVVAAVPALVLPGGVGRGERILGAPIGGVDAGARRAPFHRSSIAPPAPRRDTPEDEGGLLLGSALASRLGAKVGDLLDLRVILATGSKRLVEESLGRYTLEVRGVVTGSFGASETVFLDRAFLAAEAGSPHAATMILVYTDQPTLAREHAASVARQIPGVDARAWMDDSPYIVSSLRGNRAISAVSHAMVVAAVTIPVWALFYVHVQRRRREIGLLGAMGFRPADVFALFVLQAAFVGAFGAVVGAAIGLGICRWFAAHPIFDWEGFVIRPVLSVEGFVRPALVVLAATLTASVIPAWIAARTDPGRAIRGVE
jgi:ABC-type lipoprotein release transport system permease subunit